MKISSITRIISSEFDHDAGVARSAASLGPVFITVNGRPEHVLMTFSDYTALSSSVIAERPSIVDQLHMPGIADIDFDPPQAQLRFLPASFS